MRSKKDFAMAFPQQSAVREEKVRNRYMILFYSDTAESCRRTLVIQISLDGRPIIHTIQ